MFKKALTAGAVFLGLTFGAQAATYNFDYTTSGGNVLAGTAETSVSTAFPGFIEVDALNDLTLDGVSVGPVLQLFSLEDTFAAGLIAPVGTARIAQDLSTIDVGACLDAACNEGFVIAVLPGLGSAFSGSINGIDFDDNPIGQLNFTELAPVPLPASGLLLIAGLGGVAALRRRAKG